MAHKTAFCLPRTEDCDAIASIVVRREKIVSGIAVSVIKIMVVSNL